jgi:4,5-DOPA dioxygenase extradiol
MAGRIAAGDRTALLAYRENAPSARRAAPTPEHLDPLFVALGAAGGDRARTIFEGFHHGSLGMRSMEFRAT